MQRQQHHHRPGGLPPSAPQVGFQLLDAAAWTVGEHADRTHTDHDLAGWVEDAASFDPTPGEADVNAVQLALSPEFRNEPQDNGPVIYRFTVGRLSCAVISDGQMTPPWEPPLAAFFTPAAGVPDRELHAALAAEGQHRTTVSCGYNCVLVQTSNGHEPQHAPVLGP